MILLEIITAMAFFFFLLSTLASGITEGAALLLNKRGRELKRALSLVLDDLGPEMSRAFYEHPLIRPLAEEPKWDSVRGLGLKIINWWRFLFRKEKMAHRFPPSYIPANLFAQTLADLLVSREGTVEATTEVDLEHIKSLLLVVESLDYSNYRMFEQMYALDLPLTNDSKEAKIWAELVTVKSEMTFLAKQRNITNALKTEIESAQLTNIKDPNYYEKLKHRLLAKPVEEQANVSDLLTIHSSSLPEWQQKTEEWFDQYMDRVSGWFKKRSHTNIFWISLVLVILFNLDSIGIIQALYNSEQLRLSFLAQAEVLAASGVPTDNQQLLEATLAPFRPYMTFDWSVKEFWSHLPGYLLTAFAMTLGAPFWFNLFNRFGQLRAAGKKPE